MEYNWEEPGKSKKSTIWSHFDEEKKHQKAKLVNPFTKLLYTCKALLHTLVKCSFVEFILQDHNVLVLVSLFFLFLVLTRHKIKANLRGKRKKKSRDILALL